MNKVKVKLTTCFLFIFIIFFGTPSHSMMNCTVSDFYCDDYRNGTILCKPKNFSCTYPDDQWSWTASGVTYAAVGVGFNVVLELGRHKVLPWIYSNVLPVVQPPLHYAYDWVTTCSKSEADRLLGVRLAQQAN